MLTDRHDLTTCGVCARSACGYGYAPPRRGAAVMWVCDDPECIQTARHTYAMKQDDFNRIESMAAFAGFQAMTEYLMQIDRLDLTLLTTDEAFEAARRQVAGYRKALKTDLRNEAPF